MSHLPLDARAILEYLNELGYRNITAAQLKEFMKDLRKLIKYEESLGVDVHQKDYFDNLYRQTTASFRAKLDVEEDKGLKRDGISCRTKTADKENNLRRKAVVLEKDVRQDHDGLLQQGTKVGALQDHKQQQQTQKTNLKQEPSGSSKMTIISSKRRETKSAEEKPPTSKARTSRATEKSSNAMWIRPRSKTPHSVHHTRMDPVQLYQYYQHEWDKFKTNLPGECNRSELRWQIRHKLLGEQ